MYAVIENGGKQYRVEEGQTIRLEKMPANVGDTVDLERVIMFVDGDNIQIGAPYLESGKVTASVVGEGRGPKVMIEKFRRRKHYRRRMGHRQDFTAIKIDKIQAV